MLTGTGSPALECQALYGDSAKNPARSLRQTKAFDKLKVVIKIRLKIAFAPLPLGRAGEGAQLRQREKQISDVPGLSARAGSFLGIDS